MTRGRDWGRWIIEVFRGPRKEKPDRPRPSFRPASPVHVNNREAANVDWPRLAAELANGLWRLRKRLCQSGDEAAPQVGRAVEDAQALLDTLASAGVEVFDPVGSRVDAGGAFTILAFKSVAGLTEPRVIETVRPTIYVQSRWVQTAEVKVGLPDRFAARLGRMGLQRAPEGSD